MTSGTGGGEVTVVGGGESTVAGSDEDTLAGGEDTLAGGSEDKLADVACRPSRGTACAGIIKARTARATEDANNMLKMKDLTS